jgi:serine/threonine protein kinase
MNESVYNSEDVSNNSFDKPVSTSNQCPIFNKAYLTDSKQDNILSSNYTYIKKIYDGYASMLYIAHDLTKNKNVIIKKIPKNENWRDELHVLKHIKDNSKNGLLLSYVDFFESHIYAYIVTEYYDNFDLYEHVELNCPYKESYAKMIIKEMAKCIKACHDIDIVHLDIKCENYIVKFISETEISVILIDFGHAEILDKRNSDKIILGGFSYGTNDYLCPESNKKYFSKKSDIWALGICAFLILTGTYMFSHKVMDKERTIEKIDKSCSHYKLSQQATDFIKKCLIFEPSERPTIDNLLQDSFLQ